MGITCDTILLIMDRKEYYKEYYKRNKEKYKERTYKWRKENPKANRIIDKRYTDSHKDKVTVWKKSWFEENYEKKLLASARGMAKNKGLEFNLEVEDIVIPEYCPYLSVKLSRQCLVGRLDNKASIDRIDPTKGYIKGNVQVISNLANRMKNSATKEQLITFSTNILKEFKHEHREDQFQS